MLTLVWSRMTPRTLSGRAAIAVVCAVLIAAPLVVLAEQGTDTYRDLANVLGEAALVGCIEIGTSDNDAAIAAIVDSVSQAARRADARLQIAREELGWSEDARDLARQDLKDAQLKLALLKSPPGAAPPPRARATNTIQDRTATKLEERADLEKKLNDAQDKLQKRQRNAGIAGSKEVDDLKREVNWLEIALQVNADDLARLRDEQRDADAAARPAIPSLGAGIGAVGSSGAAAGSVVAAAVAAIGAAQHEVNRLNDKLTAAEELVSVRKTAVTFAVKTVNGLKFVEAVIAKCAADQLALLAAPPAHGFAGTLDGSWVADCRDTQNPEPVKSTGTFHIAWSDAGEVAGNYTGGGGGFSVTGKITDDTGAASGGGGGLSWQGIIDWKNKSGVVGGGGGLDYTVGTITCTGTWTGR